MAVHNLSAEGIKAAQLICCGLQIDGFAIYMLVCSEGAVLILLTGLLL